MTTKAAELLDEVLALPPVDRVAVAEKLLASLDRPDPRLDALWARESEARIAAYEVRRLPAIPAEAVFAEFDQP